MPYDQIDIHSINRTSGVYRLRLNFDGNVNWISTGAKISIPAQGCLMTIGSFKSSRLTEELSNALGNIKVELSDHPDLVWSEGTGNIIRECFEYARANDFLVHAIVARYSNDATPVFQEFVFSGSYDPREMDTAHRRVSPVGRRIETLSVEFTPAKRMDVPLSAIVWTEADMEVNVRPFWLCIVDEPGVDSWLKRYRMMPKKLTEIVTTGTTETEVTFVGPVLTTIGPVTSLTHDLAYGSDPRSTNQDVDKLKDEAGIGPFPAGNWAVKLTTAITKAFAACDMVWDAASATNLNFQISHYDETAGFYQDDGEMPLNDVILQWNYAFGFNPYDGTPFKGPATFGADLPCRDFLKAVAAQLKSRIDVYDYTAEGLPIARFVAFGQTYGAFPDLEQIPESNEGAFITDKDGVSITRRGFDGSVVAPADAKNPVEIEIPFAPFAIGYESAPCYDASRLTPNDGLEFQDQWKCGHRGALSDIGASDEDTHPLNPDGWNVGSHLFRYDSHVDNNHFPASHNQTPGNYDGGNEVIYQAGRWAGYYPVHAIYDVPRSELTDEEIKVRQKNYLISYALAFGRYLRGERRRLQIQFRGCVAPLWSDIQTGQTFTFQPLTDDVTYISVDIERDLEEDIITVQFEEATPSTLAISYIEKGAQKSTATINGQGSSEGAGGGTQWLSKVPETPTRNDTQSTDDTYSAIRLLQHSDTQSADLLPLYNHDLTVLLSGFNSAGTLFTKLQNAIEIRPADASLTGEVRFLELAANGTDYVALKSPDARVGGLVLVLPDTNPSAGQALIASSFGGGIATLGWSNIVTTLSGTLLNSPATANRNLITPIANGVRPLEIKGKSGSSADLILIQTSASQDIFSISSAGLINLYGNVILNAISGSTTIGLDTGASIDIGTAGFLLASGGIGGLLSWIDPATFVTGSVILNPLTDSRNTVAPASDIIGLILKQNSGATKDGLRVQTSGAVTTVALNATQGNNFGDVAGSNTGIPLYARQFTSGGIVSIFEYGGVGSNDITQWRDSSHVVLASVFKNGDFGNTASIGAGTLTPSLRLHVKEATLGTDHFREENNGVINNHALDELQTTDGNWHTIHSWATLSNKNYGVEVNVVARQTNNAGGLQGKGFVSKCFGGFHNIAGVLAAIGAATFIGQGSDMASASVRFNINGTTIELQVNGNANAPAAVDVTWRINNFHFMEV